MRISVRSKVIITLLTGLIGLSTASAETIYTETVQVPFGNKISEKIFNYHRHTTTMATSGKLADGALAELKAKGFKTIIDLRTPPEGTSIESQAAAKVGLSYYNLPVGRTWPSDKTFADFKTLIEDKSKHPVLVHCGSANRVGMVWSNYQINNGLSIEQAITEGRAIGMKPALETLLRKQHK